MGYIDRGGGKVKTTDPKKGPLVREMFERYATGRYTLESLCRTMNALGLRNTVGNELDQNSASRILNNRFYTGLIEIRTTGEIFDAVHESLVSKTLFDAVQDVLHGRAQIKNHRHEFTFRRLVSCGLCSKILVGERQKGHVYYRCHTRACPTKCTRETVLESAVRSMLERISLTSDERRSCESALAWITTQQDSALSEDLDALRLEEAQVKDRLGRLTDHLVDGHIDPATFEEKKRQILDQKCEIQGRIREAEDNPRWLTDRISHYLELAESAPLTYEMASPMRKRQIIETLTSNRSVSENEISVELREPFQILADRQAVSHCGEPRGLPRTWRKVMRKVFRVDLQPPIDSSTFIVAGLVHACKASKAAPNG